MNKEQSVKGIDRFKYSESDTLTGSKWKFDNGYCLHTINRGKLYTITAISYEGDMLQVLKNIKRFKRISYNRLSKVIDMIQGLPKKIMI